MEEIKKKERCIRSLCLSRQTSEESSVPEEEETIIGHLRDSQLFEDYSDFSSGLSNEDRNEYYSRKYPSFKKLEEACRQIEEEKALRAKKSILARKRLNFSSQKSNNSYNSSESLLSNSSTVAASDSGYDPDDSMSTTLHKIHNVLDSYINKSFTNSSSHVDSSQDSLLHEESFATTSTSYMELKEMLHELSFSKQHHGESDHYLIRRLSNLVDRLPRDCVTKLKTIFEEPVDDDDPSVVLFKKEMLKVTYKNLSIQEQMITYTIQNSASKVTSSSETPATSLPEQAPKTSRFRILFDSTRSRNVSSQTPVNVKSAEHKSFTSSSSPSITPESAYTTEDLNESSFTLNEKLCLGKDIPKTPQPMLELTDKEKQALKRCRKQELELASVSPYRPASRSFGSLSDWKIREEVAKRDKTLAERGTEKDKENKLEKSYADEFMEKVQKYFAESDRLKNLSGLNDTGVEVTSVHRNKLSSSNGWMKSRKRASPLRKVTGGFIKRKSLIPRYKPGVSNSKSAIMSTSKVSCMLDMINSMSDASKKAGPSTSASVSSDLTAAPGKPDSALLSSGWTASAKKSGSKFDSAYSGEFEVPVIIITSNTPEIRRKINYSPYESSEAKGEKFVGRYFCTPGRTPVPKKKRVFFPTPYKNSTPKPRAKSPVGAYIRGDLSASLISSSYRLRNEFLKKDDEF